MRLLEVIRRLIVNKLVVFEGLLEQPPPPAPASGGQTAEQPDGLLDGVIGGY